MKNLLFILTIIIAGSCSNTRQGFAQQFEQYARTELASDSLLRKLQQAHELVLAVSVETYAWVKSATIRVLALSNNEWTGYSYYVNKSQTGIVPNINPVVVNNDSCNAAWKYLQENKIWEIKGDTDGNFCGSSNSSCVINDGASWRLIILTKDKIADPAFYEPSFFEECCPGNIQRKRFLEAVDKIGQIVSVYGSSR